MAAPSGGQALSRLSQRCRRLLWASAAVAGVGAAAVIVDQQCLPRPADSGALPPGQLRGRLSQLKVCTSGMSACAHVGVPVWLCWFCGGGGGGRGGQRGRAPCPCTASHRRSSHAARATMREQRLAAVVRSEHAPRHAMVVAFLHSQTSWGGVSIQRGEAHVQLQCAQPSTPRHRGTAGRGGGWGAAPP